MIQKLLVNYNNNHQKLLGLSNTFVVPTSVKLNHNKFQKFGFKSSTQNDPFLINFI